MPKDNRVRIVVATSVMLTFIIILAGGRDCP